MALPNKLMAARMDNNTIGDTIDNNVGDLEKAICDILGIPVDTNISAKLFEVVAGGLKRAIFQNAAADPAAAGEFMRNVARLKYHNGSAVKTLANLDEILSQIKAVTMVHDGAGAWVVYKPDGTTLDTTGTTTQGLQEAITYAQANAYTLHVYGGGVLTAGTHRSRIVCTTPLLIPLGWGNGYYFHNVDLWYTTGNSADFVVFESWDYSCFHLRGELVYQGSGSALRLLPVNDQGEGFIGFTTSQLDIGSIVVADAGGAPDNTRGIAVRLSPTNGLFIENDFVIREIHGGLVGIQVDTPTNSGDIGYKLNRFVCPALHNQGQFSAKIGAGSTTRIFGNTWELLLAAVQDVGFSTFGRNDLVRLAIDGGNTGILLNSSADQNRFDVAYNAATAKVTDNSTTKNNPGAWGSEKLAVSAHKNGTNQTGVASGAATQVTLPTEEYDIGGKFAANAWTPGRACHARIAAQVYWVGTADQSSLELEVRVNNVVVHKNSTITSGSAGQAIDVNCDLQLAAVDVVTLFASQFTGSAQDIHGSPTITFFSAHITD